MMVGGILDEIKVKVFIRGRHLRKGLNGAKESKPLDCWENQLSRMRKYQVQRA